MKKYSLFILSALLLTACSSCDLLFNSNKQKDAEPVYTPNYAWKLELDGMQIHSQAYTEDNYLYLLQNIEREKEDGVQLIKIDMETGVYVWKADQIFDGHQWYSSNIVKACNKLYFMRKNGIIYCYSDVDGTLLARIQVGATEAEAIHNRCFLKTIVTDGAALYWGSAGEPGSITNPCSAQSIYQS